MAYLFSCNALLTFRLFSYDRAYDHEDPTRATTSSFEVDPDTLVQPISSRVGTSIQACLTATPCLPVDRLSLPRLDPYRDHRDCESLYLGRGCRSLCLPYRLEVKCHLAQLTATGGLLSVVRQDT